MPKLRTVVLARARCSRFGTGILVTISLRARAAGAKLKIGWDLEAGSTKNEMPPLEFELGEKSRTKNSKKLGNVDIGMPQTMCFAVVAFLKPCVLRWLSQ